MEEVNHVEMSTHDNTAFTSSQPSVPYDLNLTGLDPGVQDLVERTIEPFKSLFELIHSLLLSFGTHSISGLLLGLVLDC